MLQTRSYGTVEVTSVDREALLAELRRSAERLGRDDANVEEVALFGSFARGDHTPESDVDLLVVFRDSEVPFLARADACRDAFQEIPFDVNFTVYTDEEAGRLRRDASSFLSRVSDEVVPLFQRSKVTRRLRR